MKYTQRKFAALCDTNEHEIRALQRNGTLPEKLDDDAITTYITHLRAVLPSAPGTNELQELRIRIEKFRLAKMESDAALRARELVPAEAVALFCTAIANVIRTKLEALPVLMKNAIPHLRGSELSLVKSVIHKTLGEIATFDPSDEYDKLEREHRRARR